MTLDDFDAFSSIVIGFAEIRGRMLSAAAIELFFRAMRDWSLEDFTKAAEHLLLNSDYFPGPKEFNDLRKAGRPLAGEAWTKVLQFARRDYRPSGAHLRDPGVEFDETTRRAVASIGGFRAIAMSDPSSTPFLEKRFTDNYGSLQTIEEVRQEVPQIAQQPAARRVTGPSSAASVLKRIGGTQS
jgi:hypothetical protein